MTVTKLALPEAPTTTLYAMVVSKLKGDPILNRVIKTWSIMDGSPVNVQPASERDLPWLRISCIPDQSYPATEGLALSPIVFRLELVVDGTLFADISNLWYRVQGVLFPGDGTMMSLLTTKLVDDQGAGTRIFLTLQGFADGRIGPNDSQTQTATGLLRIERFTNTAL